MSAENIQAWVQIGILMRTARVGFQEAGFTPRESLLLAFEFVYRQVQENLNTGKGTDELMDEALKRFLGKEKGEGDG